MPSKTPYKVRVCLGNICRSPTAEAILKHTDAHGLDVIALAGTSNYHPNKAPDIRSQKHAAQRGYDLSALRARQITITDFTEFDLILRWIMKTLMIFRLYYVKQLSVWYTSNPSEIALMSEHDPNFKHKPFLIHIMVALMVDRVLDQCESKPSIIFLNNI